jgi:putative glutathione S-transferase
VDREGRAIDAELGQRVYMCGLARTQEAYETSLARVFAELDQLERRLAQQTQLWPATNARIVDGAGLSLADIQLAACLVRFDAVYFDLFKCFKRRIASYPHLAPYLRAVSDEIGAEALALDMPQVRETPS